MRPEERETAYLWDKQVAGRENIQFTTGTDQAGFAGEKTLRYAVERQLLVIGEAANHVSPVFRQSHPEVPWTAVIGLRNLLAHEYGEVLVDRIWFTATEKVPELVSLLEPLVPQT
jgi:uncharacterized protein with HEPN domain